MIRFAFAAGIYYWLIKLLYKGCAVYIGWNYPSFMNGWYERTHHVLQAIPQYGYQVDNIVRDNFADGDLVFWQIWFGTALLLSLLRLCMKSGGRRDYSTRIARQ